MTWWQMICDTPTPQKNNYGSFKYNFNPSFKSSDLDNSFYSTWGQLNYDSQALHTITLVPLCTISTLHSNRWSRQLLLPDLRTVELWLSNFTHNNFEKFVFLWLSIKEILHSHGILPHKMEEWGYHFFLGVN